MIRLKPSVSCYANEAESTHLTVAEAVDNGHKEALGKKGRITNKKRLNKGNNALWFLIGAIT